MRGESKFPLVSVIIAVKDGEPYLTQAIQSVLKQDYEPYEIIVVDGHSKDKTEEIVRSFEQIRYMPQVHTGVADARNLGIDHARGELIAFQCHDDLWSPDKLKVQVEFMLNHPRIEYTTARAKYFLETGCSVPPGFRKELFEGSHHAEIPEILLARKSLFEKVGKFDPSLSPTDDVDWFSRAKDQRIPAAMIPKVLLYKRIHDSNTSLNITSNNHKLLRLLKSSIDRKRER